VAEEYDRCRFWPDCDIHRHWIAPRFFSRRNHAEMFQMWIEGSSLGTIARQFETSTATAGRVVRAETLRLRNAFASDLEEASMG
jgi:hypothetical protein